MYIKETTKIKKTYISLNKRNENKAECQSPNTAFKGRPPKSNDAIAQDASSNGMQLATSTGFFLNPSKIL